MRKHGLFFLYPGGPGSGNLDRLKTACEKAGRDYEDITLALFGAPTNQDQLEGRIEQGFAELIFNLPQADPDTVLKELDKITELVAKVRN